MTSSDFDSEWVTFGDWEIETTYISSGEHGTIHNARLTGSNKDFVAKLLYIQGAYESEILAYKHINDLDQIHNKKVAPKLHHHFIYPGNLISGRPGGNTYVLIMDKINGITMTDAILDQNISPVEGFRRASEHVSMLHNQYNISHGDPHGRNIIITTDDEIKLDLIQHNIIFIDFENSRINPTKAQIDIDIEVLIGSSMYDYHIDYNIAGEIISSIFPFYYESDNELDKKSLLIQYALF